MDAELREMREIAPPPGALEIPVQEVARIAPLGPAWSIEGRIREGILEARERIVPRARWTEAPGGIEKIFPCATPVEAIARRGERWIFAATIGSALEEGVRDHFASGRYLEGVILDAAGSAAVESLCERVERSCAAGGPSARFSPGYCMWRLDAQVKLFELLRPDVIGIRLRPSMLMLPLKSITGLVVRARVPEDLLVPREACTQCEAHGCPRRAAGVGSS